MRRYSIVAREMQIQTTIRYHYTPIRMSLERLILLRPKCGAARTLIHCGWDVEPLGKHFSSFLKISTHAYHMIQPFYFYTFIQEKCNLRSIQTLVHKCLHSSICKYQKPGVGGNQQISINRWVCSLLFIHTGNKLLIQTIMWTNLNLIMLMKEVRQTSTYCKISSKNFIKF